jgi:hypothetical protein
MAAITKTSGKQTAGRLVLIVVAALVLFALVSYYNRKKNERFDSPPPPQLTPMPSPYAQPSGRGGSPASAAPAPSSPMTSLSSAGPFQAAPGPAPLEPTGNEQYLPVGMSDPAVGASPLDPFPQDKITPDQLLPKDAANTKWAQVNPAGQGDVKDQNFLTAGYHLGFDTQGNSLRNASHDLRSTPPNPRYRVSIWQQSTIESDLSRKDLN